VLCCGLSRLIAAGLVTGIGGLLRNPVGLGVGVALLSSALLPAVRRTRVERGEDCCRSPTRPGRPLAAQRSLPRLLWVVLAALLGVARLIHLVLTPEHAAEQPVFGAFFASAAAMQIALAVMLGDTANLGRLLCAGIVLGLVLVLIWSVTRVVGPPLAPQGHGVGTIVACGVVASVWNSAVSSGS
jgi:hypothetical protein